MEEEKDKKALEFLKVLFIIGMVICIFMTIRVLTNKNNSYHIDINNVNLIETESGYIEKLVIEEAEVIKKSIRKHRPQGQKVTRTMYNIIYYNPELGKNEEINVGKSRYDEFEVGDKIKVTREVYYNKSGLRLNYKDFVEKIEE